MNELKPCPFCGSSNTTLDYYEISCPQEIGTLVFCSDCGSYSTSVDRWNTRPIEDALQSQLAARDALIERLVEAGNNKGWSWDRKQEVWCAVIAEYQAMKGGEG